MRGALLFTGVSICLLSFHLRTFGFMRGALLFIGMFICLLVSEYYDPYARENFKPSTVHGYSKLWKDALCPRVGEIRLRDFKTVDGHPRHIQLLEDARTNILETLSTPGSWPPTRKRTRATGYSQFDSRECYFGQAADIAAGLARQVYETEKLVAIVSRFEHVTHNGERMSLKGAEEQMRRTQLGNG